MIADFSLHKNVSNESFQLPASSFQFQKNPCVGHILGFIYVAFILVYSIKVDEWLELGIRSKWELYDMSCIVIILTECNLESASIYCLLAAAPWRENGKVILLQKPQRKFHWISV